MSADRASAAVRAQGWQGAHPANGGVDPLVALLLQRMDDQDERAGRERQEQTAALAESLDKLGGRFEARIGEQTAAMLTAVKIASGVIVIALLLLGSIGGAVVAFRVPGFEGSANVEAP